MDKYSGEMKYGVKQGGRNSRKEMKGANMGRKEGSDIRGSNIMGKRNKPKRKQLEKKAAKRTDINRISRQGIQNHPIKVPLSIIQQMPRFPCQMRDEDAMWAEVKNASAGSLS